MNQASLFRRFEFIVVLALLAAGLCSCGGGESEVSGNAINSDAYVVFAWNDLGMHCLNPTYDAAVILPPYNNLFVQVIKKGNPPAVMTTGISVDYRILNNTFSSGKTDSLGAVFSQFWSNVLSLFGTAVPPDKGLNLVDPGVHNGLSGIMLAKGDHFEADGIPVTPVDDAGTWDPYQVAEVIVKDASGKVIASTRATVPVSDEINCRKCHGADAFNDILHKHDVLHGTSLAGQKPVLCAGCHGSPALGRNGSGSSGLYLSYAIHKAHSTRGAACYDCHPGQTTKFSRSAAHTAADGNCAACHGNIANVADSIAVGRTPWSQEPKCVTCHNVSGVDTAASLYRNARGHGGLYCAACHGSPHAMTPSDKPSDNYQGLQYQGSAKTIGSCGACHGNSRGGGIGEFAEEHGGTNPRVRNACHICHTAVSTDTSKWPHAYQWKGR